MKTKALITVRRVKKLPAPLPPKTVAPPAPPKAAPAPPPLPA